MKFVLVTGANGFIGSHLVEHLIQSGRQVRCLLRETSDTAWLDLERVDVVRGDLTDSAALAEALEGVDTVYHLAGVTKAATTEEFYRVNTAGTVNLIRAIAAADRPVSRFVFVSSQAAAGPSHGGQPVREDDLPRPISRYGQSKLAAEDAVLAFRNHLPVTIVRPAIVYGPRDRDMYEYFKFVKRGFRPVMGWRNRYGSFIYVEDLVEGLIRAGETDTESGRLYFLVSDPMVSWREFGRVAAEVMNRKVVSLHISPVTSYVLALFVELISSIYGRFPVFNREKVKEFAQRAWICEGERAARELGFHPTYSLRDGIAKTIAWYEEKNWL